MSRRILALAINPGLDFSPSFLPDAPLDAAYSGVTLTAFGGTPPYAFTLVSGAWPAGITLTDNGDGTADIAGTATVAGTYSPRIRVRDGARQIRERTYTLNVQALPLSLALSLPDAEAGSAYAGTSTASGGVSPYTYSKIAGPAWLSVNATTGAVTGTPDASDVSASVAVTIRVTDDDGTTLDESDTIAVTYADLVLAGDLTDVDEGDAYTGSLTTTGGSGTLASYTITAGSLPTGMTLTPNGANLDASGTSVAGSYSLSLYVTDDAGNDSNTLAVTVEVAAVLLEAWNPADKSANITLSASDHMATLTTAPGVWCVARGLTGKNAGKWYVRGQRAGTVVNQGQVFGLCLSSMGLTSAIGLVANSVGIQGNSSTGTTRLFANGGVTGTGTLAPDDGIPAIAVDFDAGKAWLRSDDGLAWIGGGDPAAGTGPSYTFTANTTLYVGVSIFEGAQSVTLPDDPLDVTETIPTGFELWTQ